jgi:hypothetical protein
MKPLDILVWQDPDILLLVGVPTTADLMLTRETMRTRISAIQPALLDRSQSMLTLGTKAIRRIVITIMVAMQPLLGVSLRQEPLRTKLRGALAAPTVCLSRQATELPLIRRSHRLSLEASLTMTNTSTIRMGSMVC